mgnify:CR=1 FL=1
MFDDHITKPGGTSGVPTNLPIGNSDDMFASVNEEGTPSAQVPQNDAAIDVPPSAVSAGVLQPKQPQRSLDQQQEEASEPIVIADTPEIPETPEINDVPELGQTSTVNNSEPADIFSGEETAVSDVPQSTVTPQPVDTFGMPNQPNNNLSAPPIQQTYTASTPQEAPNTVPEPAKVPQPTPIAKSAEKGPGMAKMLMVIALILIGLGMLGGIGYLVYTNFLVKEVVEIDTKVYGADGTLITPGSENANKEQQDAPAFEEKKEEVIEVVPPDVTDSLIEEDEDLINEEDIDKDIDDAIIFGESIDTDGDGLDDIREADLGTSPKNWDSDGDEIGDGDEVIIWKTQPLNPDTDGDGFNDGQEIKGGYNPTGPGKLFEPPTN